MKANNVLAQKRFGLFWLRMAFMWEKEDQRYFAGAWFGECSRKCSVQLVLAAFKEAFQNRGRPSNLTFYSDRGGQYISGAFYASLRKCGVKQTLRYEYSSEAEFRKSVEAYVNFYNHIHPHQTLAYKAPAGFEELHGKEETQDL